MKYLSQGNFLESHSAVFDEPHDPLLGQQYVDDCYDKFSALHICNAIYTYDACYKTIYCIYSLPMSSADTCSSGTYLCSNSSSKPLFLSTFSNSITLWSS